MRFYLSLILAKEEYLAELGLIGTAIGFRLNGFKSILEDLRVTALYSRSRVLILEILKSEAIQEKLKRLGVLWDPYWQNKAPSCWEWTKMDVLQYRGCGTQDRR